MNIDDIKDVAREFGYREVGEYADLARWLRMKLERLEQLERNGLAHDQVPQEGT